MTIVAWPVEDDYISIEPPDGHEAGREDYERARADAAMARLRIAVQALKENLPAADHNLAHVTFNERAFIETAREALAAIGELPKSEL